MSAAQAPDAERQQEPAGSIVIEWPTKGLPAHRESWHRLHWPPVVSELSRRLKAAGCFQHTDRLDRALAALPAHPTPKEETAALRPVLGALVGLRNRPLRGRTRKETKELGELCRYAIPLVQQWLRHTANEAKVRKQAAENVKPLLAALPNPSSTNRRNGDGANTPSLTPADVSILEALRGKQSVVMSLYDLETDTSISRRTLGKRVNYLIAHRLAARPHGARRGVTITPAGSKWLDSRPQIAR
jgi:hypothetical protein